MELKTIFIIIIIGIIILFLIKSKEHIGGRGGRGGISSLKKSGQTCKKNKDCKSKKCICKPTINNRNRIKNICKCK